MRTYLALGDSMSIDTYTGVDGGGAARQLFKMLGPNWRLVDESFDGCTIKNVPTNGTGDLISLTIGGNDLQRRFGFLLQSRSMKVPPSQMANIVEQLDAVAEEHLLLLRAIRASNPRSTFLVANVYAPQTPLPSSMESMLDRFNAKIAANVESAAAHLADVRRGFFGKERTHLCRDVEPTLAGATEIARIFRSLMS